ncbi:MAG: histidinol-phosphatase HisJ family protein [Clostridia bacterium]|nr:histidinol-phosphatase HisJ family protein [Clostridia bacterium]
MGYKYLADCHSHSNCSFDAEDPMQAMCQKAQELGLAYYTITDHCECDQYDGSAAFGGRKYRDTVVRSYAEYEENQKRFPGLRFLKGIELGQPVQNLEAAEDALRGRKYDFVIGSLHQIRSEEDFYWLNPESFSPETLDDIFHRYFAEIMEMIEWGKFDSLAHITYPLRYICRPGERPSFAKYQDELDAVLRGLIEKDIAIEFNTSRILRKNAPVLPDREIFTRYKALGGRRITLGADAHNTESIASGIKEGLDLLRDIGFTEYTVYIDRSPVQVPIEYIPEEGKE